MILFIDKTNVRFTSNHYQLNPFSLIFVFVGMSIQKNPSHHRREGSFDKVTVL